MILTKADTCEEMRAALDDPSVALCYGPAERRYAINWVEADEAPITWRDRYGKWGFADRCGIYYCPWSGDPLPPYLFGTLEKILQDEFNTQIVIDDQFAGNIPPQFRSEQWWLERRIGISEEDGVFNNWPDKPWIPPEPLGPPDPEDPWRPSRLMGLPGLNRWQEEPPHMCPISGHWLWFGFCYMYAYLPFAREFGIRVLDMHRPVDLQPIRVRAVRYCPWCGTRLPENLRALWERRVRALGLDPERIRSPHTRPPGWPPELLSDAWWKAEGL